MDLKIKQIWTRITKAEFKFVSTVNTSVYKVWLNTLGLCTISVYFVLCQMVIMFLAWKAIQFQKTRVIFLKCILKFSLQPLYEWIQNMGLMNMIASLWICQWYMKPDRWK